MWRAYNGKMSSHTSQVICAAAVRNQPTEALPHLSYLPDFVPNNVKLFAPKYPPQSTGSGMWRHKWNHCVCGSLLWERRF